MTENVLAFQFTKIVRIVVSDVRKIPYYTSVIKDFVNDPRIEGAQAAARSIRENKNYMLRNSVNFIKTRFNLPKNRTAISYFEDY